MATQGQASALNPVVEACAVPDLCEADLQDTRRFLLGASDAAKEEFARRQLHARRRTTQLLSFYRSFPCHMARLHLLTSCAVTLGRLCGYSREFDEMGESFMPVTPAGVPRTREWHTYIQSCLDGDPAAVRDELWIAAHMNDMRLIQQNSLDKEFYIQANEHSRDPMWNMVRRHMEVTLGSRLMDSEALSGKVALETAIAQSLVLGFKRLFSRGWDLLRYFAKETAHATLAWENGAGRGTERSDDHWPLLQEALGPRIEKVHPLIVQFYSNPARFHARVTVQFSTLPARLGSMAATLLLGQGLYEAHLKEIETRFRAFRRADGSLHFVRELYCNGKMRGFDSDFVVRTLDGTPHLFEVFDDLNISIPMQMEPADDGGLLIHGGEIFYRGVRLPALGFQVQFRSSVVENEGRQDLRIEGRLLMQPRTAMGSFLVRKLLRRPEELGGITYVVRALPEDATAAP